MFPKFECAVSQTDFLHPRKQRLFPENQGLFPKKTLDVSQKNSGMVCVVAISEFIVLWITLLKADSFAWRLRVFEVQTICSVFCLEIFLMAHTSLSWSICQHQLFHTFDKPELCWLPSRLSILIYNFVNLTIGCYERTTWGCIVVRHYIWCLLDCHFSACFLNQNEYVVNSCGWGVNIHHDCAYMIAWYDCRISTGKMMG